MQSELIRETHLDSFVSKEAPICYGILKPGKHVEGGTPVIKVKDIIGGRIATKKEELLHTSKKIDEECRRSKLSTGDRLLTIRGTTGRVAVIPPELENANITQDTARIRVSSRDDPNYLYYALQSPHVQRQIVFEYDRPSRKGN